MTNKSKLEQYNAMANELDLMRLYLHDTQSGVKPIVVTKGTVRANLYRATNASGGYIVIRTTDGQSCNTSIAYLDDARFEKIPHEQEWSDYRIVLERCRIERLKVLASNGRAEACFELAETRESFERDRFGTAGEYKA